MRAPDTLDYLLICGKSLLGYLQLPWRPEIRQTLRRAASVLASVNPSPESIIVTLALVGGVVLFLLVEVLPGRQGPR